MVNHEITLQTLTFEERVGFINQLAKAGWEFIVLDKVGDIFTFWNQDLKVLEYVTVKCATSGKTIVLDAERTPLIVEQCHSIVVWQDCFDMLKKAGAI